ncbi:MAG: hypothetical protein ACXVCP_09625 [Bdellovibrio sp.]
MSLSETVMILFILSISFSAFGGLPSEDPIVRSWQNEFSTATFPNASDFGDEKLWFCSNRSTWKGDQGETRKFVVSFNSFGGLIQSQGWETDGNSKNDSFSYWFVPAGDFGLLARVDVFLGSTPTPGRIYVLRIDKAHNTLMMEESYPAEFEGWSGRCIGNSCMQDVWNNTPPSIYDQGRGRARSYSLCR